MKTKKLLVLLLTFVMIFSFAACGGGGGAQGDEVIFRVGMPSGFDTFNFFTTESSYVYEWMNFCYDSLIAYDEDYNPVPRLADSWEVSEDELSWTFHLHEGVTFSDGEPLTSADVKYTYENAVDSYMYSMYVGGIDSIECPDDYTVVFNCEEPKPNMLYQIVPIIPEHVWAEVDDLFSYEPDELIGSGPFIYSPQRSGNGSKAFVKNENYWGQVPNIDVLVFTEYDNYDAMAQALQIGEMDACVGLEKTQLDTLQGTSGIDASAFTSFGCEFLAYNLLDPITGDINVRHAIDYCFDKDLVVEMSYGGLADVAYGVISNEGYQYQPKEKREFNIEKANDILDKAGYVDTNGDGIREMNGKPLSIELTTASERSSWQSATVNMMITNCAKAGIEITWNPLEKTTMWDTCIDGSPDWQMNIEGWVGDADPGFMLSIFLDWETDGYSGTSYQNPDFDALYNKVATTVDKDERAKLIEQAQTMLYEDCPYTNICFDKAIQAVNTGKWGGLTPNSNGYFENERIDNFLNVTLR